MKIQGKTPNSQERGFPDPFTFFVRRLRQGFMRLLLVASLGRAWRLTVAGSPPSTTYIPNVAW